jgi:hypothetical protein
MFSLYLFEVLNYFQCVEKIQLKVEIISGQILWLLSTLGEGASNANTISTVQLTCITAINFRKEFFNLPLIHLDS